MTAKYMGYRLAQWLSVRLPAASACGLAERLADVRWRCAPRDRAVVAANIGRLIADRPAEHPRLIREVFRNFGRYLVEFFAMHHLDQPDLDIEGYPHLLEAQQRRRGAIILTAHLGNWELGAVLIHRLGHPVTAVALPHEDVRMDRLFNRQRQICGIEVVSLGDHAAKRSLQALREGRLLGVLGDREFGTNGLAVPFAGTTMVFPKGPALLSLRSRAPLVPAFLLREGVWKFRLCFEPPIWPERGRAIEGAVRSAIQTYAANLERRLKRSPEQWLMFQPITATV